MIPGGLRRNEESFGRFVVQRRTLDEVEHALLFDPQTSGGLFAAVAAEEAERVLESFRAEGEPVWRIGHAVAGEAGGIEVG
jgi:selenide,water dikinase